jgi:hypothetical protein
MCQVLKRAMQVKLRVEPVGVVLHRIIRPFDTIHERATDNGEQGGKLVLVGAIYKLKPFTVPHPVVRHKEQNDLIPTVQYSVDELR